MSSIQHGDTEEIIKVSARGLEEFDERLSQVLDTLKDTDMLVITADHGCDPTYKGTDHTRGSMFRCLYMANV